MSYREHLEHWCETPPTHLEKIPEMPGIELSALTDDALLDLVASTKNAQKLLTERLSVLTAEILDQHRDTYSCAPPYSRCAAPPRTAAPVWCERNSHKTVDISSGEIERPGCAEADVVDRTNLKSGSDTR